MDSVRIYDIVLVMFSALFLLYLIVQLVPTIKKLKGSVSLFKMLYTMVWCNDDVTDNKVDDVMTMIWCHGDVTTPTSQMADFGIS